MERNGQKDSYKTHLELEKKNWIGARPFSLVGLKRLYCTSNLVILASFQEASLNAMTVQQLPGKLYSDLLEQRQKATCPANIRAHELGHRECCHCILDMRTNELSTVHWHSFARCLQDSGRFWIFRERQINLLGISAGALADSLPLDVFETDVLILILILILG